LGFVSGLDPDGELAVGSICNSVALREVAVLNRSVAAQKRVQGPFFWDLKMVRIFRTT
jgi:hypothetical protein